MSGIKTGKVCEQVYHNLKVSYKYYQGLVKEINEIEQIIGKKKTVYCENIKWMKELYDDYKCILRIPENIEEEYEPKWILTGEYGYCGYEDKMKSLINERESRLIKLKYKYHLWHTINPRSLELKPNLFSYSYSVK